MNDHETSRIVDATKDRQCVKCGHLMPRGYRHFERDAGGRLERYHVHCARAAGIQARCLEPKPRCQPVED